MRKLFIPLLASIILTLFAYAYFSQASIEFEGLSVLALLPIAANFALIFSLFRAKWFAGLSKKRRAFLGWLFLTFFYVVYLTFAQIWSWPLIARFLAYLFIPFVAYLGRSQWPQRLSFADIAVILAVWFPIDFGVLQEAWPWPQGLAKNVYAIPLAMSVCLLSLREIRELEGMKWSFTMNRRDWKYAAMNLCLFLALALPIGALTGFISWSPRDTTGIQLIATLVATFLLVALPEELLFRGVLQNFLQKTFKKPDYGLMLASVIFGLSHLNNGPSPDWRYALLATGAGFFYGKTFNGGTSILPAVIVHTCVDVIWIQFFYK